MPARADHQLLLGLLALQNGFITRDQLVSAFGRWTVDKSLSLDQILLEQRALDVPRQELLVALAAQHLRQHAQDPAQSLAALSSIASARLALHGLQDADLAHSLGHVGVAHPTEDPFATRAGASRIPGERFQILRPHAAGGLGVVSIAHDSEVPREVALKEIRPESADNAEARTRFLREAEITGGLEHPGIVPVYGLGTYADGRPYYAMKFVNGDSLQTATARFHEHRKAGTSGYQSVEFRELLQRFIDVCQAMQYAHDRGVLHRDLKPGNIMLGQYGETLVVDWGLAKPLAENALATGRLEKSVVPRTPLSGTVEFGTQAGAAVGTPQYMSPEQAEGRLDDLGPATDVYSLGATLYHVLTGQPPAVGNNVAEVLENVRRGTLIAPREHVSAIPRPLEAICRKAMSLRAADRYPQTRMLSNEISRWLADDSVQAYPEGWGGRVARWFRHHRAVALSASVAAPTVLASIGIASYLVGIAEQSAAQSQHRETQALALTTHVTAFETALQRENWDAAHLQSLDATVAALQKLSTERANEAKGRLAERYASLLEQKLRRPRLTESDLVEFNADIARLELRDAAAADRVRQALIARRNSWEVVAELQGDFDGWSEILDSAAVELKEGELVRKLPSSDPSLDRVKTSLAATADVQCEATFTVAAPLTGPLGVEFLQSDTSGYSFLLVPEARSANAPSPKVSGDAPMRIQIQRDGLALREADAPRDLLAEGTVTIQALRQGERLQIQINDLAPMEMLDPFPLPVSQPGSITLRWGTEARSLLELVSSQMRRPLAPSPLEVADQLYSRGDFREALRKYQEQSQQSGGNEYGREAQYKQAVCLQALGQFPEAQALYEPLSAADQDRWSTLADFQLWARALEENNAELAETIYHRLSQRYSFEELARIAPEETRERIYKSAFSSPTHYERFLFYDPNRFAKLERTYDLYALLSHGSHGYQEAAFQFAQHAAFLGRYDRALQTLREKRFSPAWYLSDVFYLRLLRESGQPLLSIEEAERLEKSETLSNPVDRSRIVMQRALCLLALGRTDEARELVSSVIPAFRESTLVYEHHVAILGQPLMVHAYLQADAGNEDVALSAWQECASHTPIGNMRSYFIGRAMTGTINDADAERFIEAGITLDSTGLGKVVLSYVPREKLSRVIKEMWVSPRGKAFARKIALEQTSYREEALSLPIIGAYQFVVQELSSGQPDPEQDEAFWAFAEQTVHLLAIEGTLQSAQLLPFAVTWKGNPGFLGWKTVQATLPVEYRGHLAYIFGLRYLKLQQPEEARKFFQTTLRDAAPESLFSRLAARELATLDAPDPAN